MYVIKQFIYYAIYVKTNEQEKELLDDNTINQTSHDDIEQKATPQLLVKITLGMTQTDQPLDNFLKVQPRSIQSEHLLQQGIKTRRWQTITVTPSQLIEGRQRKFWGRFIIQSSVTIQQQLMIILKDPQVPKLLPDIEVLKAKPAIILGWESHICDNTKQIRKWKDNNKPTIGE